MDDLDHQLAQYPRALVLFYRGFFCMGQREYTGVPTHPDQLDDYRKLVEKSTHYKLHPMGE